MIQQKRENSNEPKNTDEKKNALYLEKIIIPTQFEQQEQNEQKKDVKQQFIGQIENQQQQNEIAPTNNQFDSQDTIGNQSQEIVYFFLSYFDKYNQEENSYHLYALYEDQDQQII